jgi:hypothetical protein
MNKCQLPKHDKKRKALAVCELRMGRWEVMEHRGLELGVMKPGFVSCQQLHSFKQVV